MNGSSVHLCTKCSRLVYDPENKEPKYICALCRAQQGQGLVIAPAKKTVLATAMAS